METFDEAAAEWVRRHYPGEQPLVGSVEFEFEMTGYGGELEHSIELSYDVMYRPKRGMVRGKWQYGEAIRRTKSCKIDPQIDLMTLLRGIVEIVTEASAKTNIPEETKDQL